MATLMKNGPPNQNGEWQFNNAMVTRGYCRCCYFSDFIDLLFSYTYCMFILVFSVKDKRNSCFVFFIFKISFSQFLGSKNEKGKYMDKL